MIELAGDLRELETIRIRQHFRTEIGMIPRERPPAVVALEVRLHFRVGMLQRQQPGIHFGRHVALGHGERSADQQHLVRLVAFVAGDVERKICDPEAVEPGDFDIAA